MTNNPPNMMGVYRWDQTKAAWQNIFCFTDFTIALGGNAAYLAAVNVETGWQEWELKSASDTIANAIAVCPTDPNRVVVTNQTVQVTSKATAISLVASDTPAWLEAYTTPAGARKPGENWSSRGLEVTSTWRYFVRSTPIERYIGYTDIGLARSADFGESWARMLVPIRGLNGNPRNNPPEDTYLNCYDIVEAPNGKELFAAVSQLHDIPQDYAPRQYASGPHGGGVFTSVDGIAWTDLSGNLPDNPVTSLLVEGRDPIRLWASVFGDGVYIRDGVGPWKSIGFPKTQAHPSANRNVTRLEFDLDHTVLCAVMSDGAADPGGVWRFDGTNWIEKVFDPKALGAGYVMDFGVDPDVKGHYFVGTAGFNGPYGGVYEKRPTAPSFVKVIDFDGAQPNVTYVKNTGYSDVLTGFGAFFQKGHVFVTTDSHGIWTRDASGMGVFKEWLPANQAFPYLRTSRMAFVSEPIGLYRAGLELIAGGGLLALIGVIFVIVAVFVFLLTFGALKLTEDAIFVTMFGYGVVRVPA